MNPSRKLWAGIAAMVVLSAGPVLADISIESGPGRVSSSVQMVTLFNRDSTRDEWVTLQLHFGRILRQMKDRLEDEGTPDPTVGEETEEFRFAGIDLAVGHTSLNPYILMLIGVTNFAERTHRLGTPWNFHLGLQFGSHGPEFGWFLSVHHWSNGPELTGAPGPNRGEEFGTFGLEWRF